MHSELIGVSVDGKLHQWKWNSERPFHLAINVANDSQSVDQSNNNSNNTQITVTHPKTLFLQVCIIKMRYSIPIVIIINLMLVLLCY